MTDNDFDSEPQLSRRSMLEAAVGLSGAALLTGAAAVAPSASASAAEKRSDKLGRKFRAFIKRSGKTSIEECRLLPLEPKHILVKTQAAQLCYSEVANVLGNQILGTQVAGAPAGFGHGGVGIVEEISPDVVGVRVGDRVMVPIAANCGRCFMCLQNRGDVCQANLVYSGKIPWAVDFEGKPIDLALGGLAEYLVTTEYRCIPVETKMSSLELSTLCCPSGAGLGSAITLVRTPLSTGITPGSSVVVLGAGPVGLGAVQGARIMGASQIIIIEPIKARRDLAMKLGATYAIDPNQDWEHLVDHVRDMTKGSDRVFAGGRHPPPPDFIGDSRGGDMVINCSGATYFPPKVEQPPDATGIETLKKAWAMTRTGGHTVLLGVGYGNREISFPAWEFANLGRTIWPFNAIAGNRDLPNFVRLLESGQFDAKSIATGVFPLERALEGYQAASDRTTVSAHVVYD